MADVLFVVGAAIFAMLAYHGIIAISHGGAFLDSDLMTYAQGMAGEARPEFFAGDPVLSARSPSNSIPNLERVLGGWLTPGNNWAEGLLKAGAVAIFIFYCSWYFLGRWLYGSPALAALLSLVCGITVWVGWGTFWGITHSDPIPRVFFGALLPILLWLGIAGITRPYLRPAAMGLAGLFMWVHGVSALNAGAMLFMVFLFNRAPGYKHHFGNLAICLAAFLIPVAIFLWPSLHQGHTFTADELNLFRDMLELRWREDYGDFWVRLARFFNPTSDVFPILLGGLAGFFVILFMGGQREKLLCRIYPCFIGGLLLVALFCWAESAWSPSLGRLPMGHELVRGMRFMVPISWMLAIGGIACLGGKWLRVGLLCATMCAILLFSRDRQLMAAEYAITNLTGIRLPLSMEGEIEKAQSAHFAAVIEELQEIVPPGEAIYSPEDLMQIRYKALRPLAHAFKDGYIYYYNKDLEGSRNWLELEELRRSGPTGWQQAWQTSGAKWLLIRAGEIQSPQADMEIVLDKNGWILARKNVKAGA